MRALFRRIRRNGVAISTLRILGTALVLAFGSQPIQSARAAESAVVTPLMLKELADVPGKEMLMITVDYPPGAVDPVHRHDAGRSQCEYDGASEVHRDPSEEERSRRGVARRVVRLSSARRNEDDGYQIVEAVV